MSPPDREQLKTQRREGKGVITRHLRTINRLINEDNVEQVPEQLDKLRSAFDNLEEIHSKYHELLVDEADLVASDEWFDEVDDSYNEGIRNTRHWLRVQDELKLNASMSSTSSGTNTMSLVVLAAPLQRVVQLAQPVRCKQILILWLPWICPVLKLMYFQGIL